MSFIQLDDIALHYADEGDKSAPAIVFSNSLGTDFRIWDAMIVSLKASGLNARFIRYDKRGHGLSDATPQPYKMDQHVDDLIGLLGALGAKNAVLIGLSVGGMIVQGVYGKRPDLVRALVLSDTGHKIGEESMWNDRIKAVNEGGIEALETAILERWFSESYRRADNPDFPGYRNMLIRTPVEGYCGTSAALRDADYTEIAKSISVPTMLLVGSNDGSTPPEMMAKTHELISGSRFEIIDGPGHLPCIEAPDETARLFMDFYKGL
ncbi:MAG: 3-oxoadipate enol-lactonase [Hyphomicrobiales bacterium]|nr:MAG: 3-oxoadipate enol-lactonase [Hyphomicrobiales bacterium]